MPPGGEGEARECVRLVPLGVGHLDLAVIGGRRVGVLGGREREAGGAEAVLLAECLFGVALRPEDFPTRHALGSGSLDKFIDVAVHIVDIQ